MIILITRFYLIFQISVFLCKDQPNTPLLDLMKKSGVQEIRRVLGDYVRQLKSGMVPSMHWD